MLPGLKKKKLDLKVTKSRMRTKLSRHSDFLMYKVFKNNEGIVACSFAPEAP